MTEIDDDVTITRMSRALRGCADLGDAWKRAARYVAAEVTNRDVHRLDAAATAAETARRDLVRRGILDAHRIRDGDGIQAGLPLAR